jgi:hypothetical protein
MERREGRELDRLAEEEDRRLVAESGDSGTYREAV